MPRFRLAIILSLAAGLIGAIPAITPLGLSMEEELGLRLLFSLRGAVEPPDEVVIVSTESFNTQSSDQEDEENPWGTCLARLRAASGGEWPRCIYARLVDALVQQGASVVVFDIVFKDAGDPEEDAQFAAAIRRSQRVVLLQHLRVDRIRESHIWKESLISPIPALSNAAIGLGPFPLPKVPVRVNQFWAIKTAAGDAPTLPVVALQVHALPLLGRYLELLDEVGIGYVADLPRHNAQVKNAADLNRLMRGLRHAVRSSPKSLRRLSNVLNTRGQSSLSRSEHLLLGALTRAYGGPSSYYVNFYGPPGTISTLSINQVLAPFEANSPDADPDLAGKIVFVGPSETTTSDQRDGFFTVFSRDDGVDLSGVEIAASALANMLSDRTLRELSNLSIVGLVMAFGCVVGFLASMLPGVRAVLAVLAVAGLYLGTAQIQFSTHGIWMPLIIPLFWQLPLSLVSGLLLQYRVVRRDSEKVSRAIRHYVPENVADSLIRQGEAGTPTELIYGVCLATDAEHYTNVSERLSPGDLATLMNDYFRLLSRPIERYDGEVYELSADSMMCLWRAPQADRATRLEACSAALEIDQALKEFNALHEDRQLPTRLGLHAGWVATANLKAGEHYTYSLIGDMANTASRIEGLNRYLGTRILASEPVIEDLDSFLMRCMGSFRLEGKSEPLTIFQILGSKKSMAEESRDLCQRFEQALQVFRTGKWSSAIDAFDVVLSTHPGDGPSEFYRGRCERYLTFPPTTDPAWIIQMEAK